MRYRQQQLARYCCMLSFAAACAHRSAEEQLDASQNALLSAPPDAGRELWGSLAEHRPVYEVVYVDSDRVMMTMAMTTNNSYSCSRTRVDAVDTDGGAHSFVVDGTHYYFRSHNADW